MQRCCTCTLHPALHPCTLAPLHPCTLAPLHPCTPAPLHPSNARVKPFTVPVMLAIVALATAGLGQPSSPFDVLIRNGRVFDGSGNPWFPSDVAVKDGRIVAVGRLARAQAVTTIDATGKYVTPGFIDIHSHADDGSGPEDGLRDQNRARRAAPNLVSQGITTVVVNQDGRSPWPISAQRALLEQQGIGVNAMLMVGHGTVRRLVMKDDVRRASVAAERTRMRELLRQGLEEGAVGLSAGLGTSLGAGAPPTRSWSSRASCLPWTASTFRTSGAKGSDPLWYVPSQDGPGPPTLLDAVTETIAIGEQTGARVVASHLKAKGEHYWGSSAAAVGLIQRARDRGVDVWADQSRTRRAARTDRPC